MVKKNLKNLRNSKADNLETWRIALGTQVLPCLFKERPWVDHDLFYGKVNLVPYAFIWQNAKIMPIILKVRIN